MSLIEKLIIELENMKVKWALCGGLAIDTFLGYSSRIHKDLDIAVCFDDIEEVIEYLKCRGWKAFAPVGQGRFVEFNQVLEDNLYFDNVWCFKADANFIIETKYEDGFRFFELNRAEQIDLDFIEVLCSNEDLDQYIYLKNDAITRKRDKAYIEFKDFNMLAPEIILLYKLRSIKNIDYKQDFNLVIDKLSDEQREWLRLAIEIEYPEGHEWFR
jgi:hypothetical protein